MPPKQNRQQYEPSHGLVEGWSFKVFGDGKVQVGTAAGGPYKRWSFRLSSYENNEDRAACVLLEMRARGLPPGPKAGNHAHSPPEPASRVAATVSAGESGSSPLGARSPRGAYRKPCPFILIAPRPTGHRTMLTMVTHTHTHTNYLGLPPPRALRLTLTPVCLRLPRLR